MKLSERIIFYILLISVQVYFDPFVYKCTRVKGKLLIIFHHIIQIYSIFGSLIFENYYLHTFCLLLAFICHILLKKCFVTKLQNDLCDFNNNARLETFLNHILRFLNIEYTNTIYYVLLLCVIFFNTYNIKYQ